MSSVPHWWLEFCSHIQGSARFSILWLLLLFFNPYSYETVCEEELQRKWSVPFQNLLLDLASWCSCLAQALLRLLQVMFSCFRLPLTFTGCPSALWLEARPLPPLSFTYLLLLWTEDLLCFIGLEFIPVIHHFCTRCCLDLASRNPMGMAPVFLWHAFIIFWALLYFLAEQDVPGSFCA